MHGNNIQADISCNGQLFRNGFNSFFIPNPGTGGQNPSTISSAGLWIGGIDQNGGLRLAQASYSGGYWVGPLDPANGVPDATACINWNRVFRSTRTGIDSFLTALPDLQGNPASAIAQFPSILGWPGQGNPYFSTVWGFDLPATGQSLAGFYDNDQDGAYDPLSGDFPAVELQGTAPFVADEFVWCVHNGHSNSPATALPVEVQLTAWAFHCPNKPALDNTVFTAHKMIYRDTNSLNSCFIGIFADLDIGCAPDDYIGCKPELNSFFAYNQDITDGDMGAACSTGPNDPTFGSNPPVQSVTLLSHPMEKFVYYNNPSFGSWPPAMGDPDQPVEYYNYLSGHWRDGSPVTSGGSAYQSGGQPANFCFPGDPAKTNTWSMCSANLASGDRRGLAITRPGLSFDPAFHGEFQPGQVEEVVTAWTTHLTPNLPCDLGNTFDEIANLRADFANQNFYENVCLSSGTLAPLRPLIKMYPNPAHSAVTLEFGDWPVREIRLINADGRLVKTIQNAGTEQITIPVDELPNGLYAAETIGENGNIVACPFSRNP